MHTMYKENNLGNTNKFYLTVHEISRLYFQEGNHRTTR